MPDENPKLKEDTAAAQVPDSMKKVKGVICMRFALMRICVTCSGLFTGPISSDLLRPLFERVLLYTNAMARINKLCFW